MVSLDPSCRFVEWRSRCRVVGNLNSDISYSLILFSLISKAVFHVLLWITFRVLIVPNVMNIRSKYFERIKLFYISKMTNRHSAVNDWILDCSFISHFILRAYYIVFNTKTITMPTWKYIWSVIAITDLRVELQLIDICSWSMKEHVQLLTDDSHLLKQQSFDYNLWHG